MSTNTTGGRPTPVLDAGVLAGRISALVTAIGGALVLVGITTAGNVQAWSVVVGGVVLAGASLIAYLLPVIQARKAAELVTPVDSPQDDDGTPLVRAIGIADPIPPASAADGATQASWASTDTGSVEGS